ncbi:MAG: asparagine synthase (glutamine-hydrolyzing) [Bacteroidales bacterium]|nr:asparagine synthase (glutamine-hydrolyzing) [Bacteroidales bacterium]
MCGISAIYRYTNISAEDKRKLPLMSKEMEYRGPDDSGLWFDEQCGMAQTRLSIIGLQKGHQPLFNEDKSLVLICNGEIYNYIELKAELTHKGRKFYSDSDSETILHLYEEYGEKCLQYLRGQFAFCLWDSKKKQLFAARDRIGEKTLYYSEIPGGTVFCTELKTLLKYYVSTPQINLYQLAAPIRYTSPLSKKDTFIEQVKRIEPGQYILVNETGLYKHKYWKRSTKPTYTGSYEQAKSETLRLMKESVDIHLRSDVPIAIMLSGGIDSSAIAALAKETGREVHTITAGYKGQHDCDERSVAKQFAKEKGFIYHEVELGENDFNNSFEEFTQYIDEPITDSAAIAQWALYKKVKSLGFKVLLGGMGGDELFYGYPYWNKLGESLSITRYHQALFPWNSVKKKKTFLKFLFKNWKYILHAGYPMKITDSSIGSWQYDDYVRFSKNAVLEYNSDKFEFSRLNLYKAFGNCELGKELDLVYEFSFDNIMTMAYLYLSDRLGMGNSLEIRSPLLDYKLVEFVSGLPTEIKYRKGQPKYFLKEILQGIVPGYILDAQKRGFTPPDSFIRDVVEKYKYRFIKANHKYYNSILADRLLTLLLNND